MTIRITIKNESDDREIEVGYLDMESNATDQLVTNKTVIGPSGSAEFHVHGATAVAVREVPNVQTEVTP